MKMKERNSQLKNVLGAMVTPEVAKTISSVKKEDTVNRCGYASYSLEDELRLISMLNTLKLEPQYYRSENDTMKELRDLIEKLGLKDPYFVAQAIVYSRCKGEGMRSINHLAAALLAPFIAGQEYAKRFYGAWNKKEDRGGCIYRPDDMTEIKDVYNALNSATLSNAMKKGFASVIESLDTYLLAKYKKSIIDIANLVHPNPMNSTATIVDAEGKTVKVLDALMHGITVTADTWEAAQSEAGQEVAKAVKEGKLTKEKAEQVLKEAKAENWNQLLSEGKLGILAALRNIRNILNVCDSTTVNILCNLLSNGELIRKGKIMPYQIDTAYEVVRNECTGSNARLVLDALQKGYVKSVPNLKEAMPGKTAVLIDCSGSMNTRCATNKRSNYIQATAAEKAGLLAATIALSTNADVIRFGSHAEEIHYDLNDNVFRLGKTIGNANLGGTNINSAFRLLQEKYDRIIVLSDNEINYGGWVSDGYKDYMRRTGANPHIYCIDLACYGTQLLAKSDKVHYYFGYGYAMFDDIASKEFNPMMHIDKVRQIVI